MKIILAAVLLACGVLGADAQFAGKLTYSIVSKDHTLYMVYYQNGNNARVEARSLSNADSSVLNTQDTLLFDIAAKKTTHLVYKTGMAVIMMNTATFAQQALVNSKSQSSVSVQTIGAETVNGYACTHYVIVGQTGKAISKRDVWVTTSLGTPGIQVVGSFLYYTPDFQQEQKLVAAGGAGVVVKTSISIPGFTTVMNLVSVDTKTPAARLFSVPSWYTVVDRSNMTVPANF